MPTILEQKYIDRYLDTMYPKPVAEPKFGRGGVTAKQSEAAGGLEVPAKAMLDMGAATVKGATQGFLGLPGDLESLSYGVKEIFNRGGNEGMLDAFLRGMNEKTIMPNTEEVKAWLDKNVGMVNKGKNPYESIGEFAAPGGYVKAAKTTGKVAATGVKKAATELAPNAAAMAENYLTKTGMVIKIAPDSPSIKIPSAPKLNTPEFKNWFSDSKVIDNTGKPIVMYHGTNKLQDNEAFTSFDTYGGNYGLFGNGGYFTENSEVASSYTKKGKGTNPTVYPVYLSIKNPIDMNATAKADSWKSAYDEIDFSELDGKNATNEDYYRIAEEHVQYEGFSRDEGSAYMQEGLMSMGHDGITHIGGGRRSDGNISHRVYIAFHPEQIKSVFNKGTWDPNDPRILHGGGAAAVSGAATQDKEKK